MNKLTSYEQLIAEKVQQVAIPDMANNIWSQIELALDGGASGNGSGEQAPTAKKPGGGSFPGKARYFYLGGCFIIGVIIFVMVATRRQHKRAKPSPARSEKQTVQPGSAGEIPPGSDKKTVILSGDRVIQHNDAAKIPLLPLVRSVNDSMFNLPLLVHDRDSMSLQGQTFVQPSRTDSLLFKPTFFRKPRGVMNISDSDYKIKAFKDSTKTP